MFRRVLVANRGEIAVRVMRTLRKLGIESVAVYSDADRQALHVLEADMAVHIGPAPAPESYLSIGRIVDAAKATGSEAVHPGYGFLSENGDFAEACEAAGIRFIGPAAGAIRTMGDKLAARRLVAEHGVPVVPGFDEPDQDDERLAEAAGDVGFPLMVKAAAGGGGRGMRRVEGPDTLVGAIEGARREATRSFGDGRLFLERVVEDARHVEVQVLADSFGNAVHLGERDCSVQRRHQKVIEEAPSPVIDGEMRERLGAAALQAVRAVGYQNAGTVEFLYDARDRSFFFLEMNTRLQVEHGVTELVTGLDLVELQLAVASGEALPADIGEAGIHGHAIECRLYAEDPRQDHRPSPGRIDTFNAPAGPGIRVDAGTYAGDEISPYYDPMVAKVLAHGETREAAIATMTGALEQMRIDGITTNRDLLLGMLAHPTFARGEATTAFLDTVPLAEVLHDGLDEDACIAAFGAVALGAGTGDNPWEAHGAWRPSGRLAIELDLEGRLVHLSGERSPREAGAFRVGVEEDPVRSVVFATPATGTVLVREGEVTRRYSVARDAQGVTVEHAGRVTRFRWPSHAALAGEYAGSEAGATELRAPMAGRIARVLRGTGDTVAANEPVVILEAMKMEHVITAPAGAVIGAVHCAAGDSVANGQVLVELAAPG